MSTHHTGWDDLPSEIVGKILEMRGEMMFKEEREREVAKIVAQFWAKVWRAKPRVFRRRLPPGSHRYPTRIHFYRTFFLNIFVYTHTDAGQASYQEDMLQRGQTPQNHPVLPCRQAPGRPLQAEGQEQEAVGYLKKT